MSWFMEISLIVYGSLYYTFILFFHENQMSIIGGGNKDITYLPTYLLTYLPTYLPT